MTPNTEAPLTEQVTVLFVPGILARPIHYILGTYFIDQIQFLKRQGIPWRLVPVHHEKSIQENSLTIKNTVEELAAKNQKIIFFTHSKGGLDVLEALLKYPEIRPHIMEFIALQAPFYGSPVANTIVSHKFLRGLARILLLFLRGTLDSLVEMTTDSRWTYMKKYRRQIFALSKEVRIVSIASSKHKQGSKIDSLLKISRDLMEKHFIENDGLVPLRSAILPGSQKIYIPNLDHASAVIRRTPLYFDRRQFTENIFQSYFSVTYEQPL